MIFPALHVAQGHLDLGLHHSWFIAELSCELLVVEFSGRVLAKNSFKSMSILLNVDALRGAYWLSCCVFLP